MKQRVLPQYARNLRSALHRTRLEQKDIAEALGVSRATVCLWAKGLRKPTAEHQELLALAFDTSPRRFRFGTSQHDFRSKLS